MRQNESQKRTLFFVIIVAICLISGCAKKADNSTELWVVTEKTEWNKMNFQVRFMADQFQEEHPGWTVKLDILPTEEPARSRYLKQLRTWIMGGRGPDVFLMPTDTTIVRQSNLFVYDQELLSARARIIELEPLFLDVEQIMTNGIFLDVSDLFNADTELKTEQFQQQIMDAGCYRGGRYILPLRYNFPVLYADPVEIEKWGLTVNDLDKDVSELLDAVIASGDQLLACSAEPFFLRTGLGFSLLPNPLSYSPENVTVTSEEVSHFLRQIQDLEALVGEKNEHRHELGFTNFLEGSVRILSEGRYGKPIGNYKLTRFPTVLPMQVGFFDDAALVTAISRASNHEYAMIPLRDADGKQAAYVTYFGAINAGCRHIPEAYDFLRMFLTERAQFEYDSPVDESIWMHGVPHREDFIADGWPVRVWDSTEQIWDILRTSPYMVKPDADSVPINMRKLITNHLTDEDLPLLHTQFDRVYFGCVLEQDFAQMVRSLNDQDTGEPSDVDIDAMAEEFIEKLTWHVMEG